MNPKNPVPTDTDPSPLEVIPSKAIKILYSWKATSRPFKKRDKEFWTTVITILILVSLILFFVKEWFLIATLISLTFVYYVLSTVPPEEIEYKITNKGILFAGDEYPYETINQFWFSEKYGHRLINFELKTGLIGRLTLVINPEDEKKLKEILQKYLVEETVKPTFLDKASNWLQNKISFESPKKKNS